MTTITDIARKALHTGIKPTLSDTRRHFSKLNSALLAAGITDDCVDSLGLTEALIDLHHATNAAEVSKAVTAISAALGHIEYMMPYFVASRMDDILFPLEESES